MEGKVRQSQTRSRDTWDACAIIQMFRRPSKRIVDQGLNEHRDAWTGLTRVIWVITHRAGNGARCDDPELEKKGTDDIGTSGTKAVAEAALTAPN